MAGNVTESREHRVLRLPYVVNTQGTGDVPNFRTVGTFTPDFLTKETTTSYRSRGRDDDVDSWSTVTQNGFQLASKYDRGHPFVTEKKSIGLTHKEWFLKASQPSYAWYRGPLVPMLPGNQADRFMTLPSWDSKLMGARAIRATIPTSPHANLAQFLGELHEGLPSLIGASLLKQRASVARSAGSEFLNVEFGWIPLLSDLRSFIGALSKASKVFQDGARNSGGVIRRRHSFESQVSTFDPQIVYQAGLVRVFTGGRPSGNGYSGWTNVNSDYLGPITSNRLVTQKFWFAGAYSYYLDPGKTLLGRLNRYEQLSNQLLGTRLTPSVLWELAPWSWLVDWVFDIGTAVSNASALANDSLVLRYGYLMRHTVAQDIYTSPMSVFRDGGDGVFGISFRTERKERVRATPYGFGLDPSSFTARQWAILGALGLSRGTNRLP